MKIRDANEKDLPALLDIHNHAVDRLTAAWTTTRDTIEGRRRWLEDRQIGGFSVVVAVGDRDDVLGYGSFGPFRGRDGYRKTIEHSVYVVPGAQRRGVGGTLLEYLIKRAREDDFHVIVAVIDGENGASIKLHQRFGFEISGRLPEVGTKFGRWLDLVLMTLVLNDAAAPPA